MPWHIFLMRLAQIGVINYPALCLESKNTIIDLEYSVTLNGHTCELTLYRIMLALIGSPGNN